MSKNTQDAANNYGSISSNAQSLSDIKSSGEDARILLSSVAEKLDEMREYLASIGMVNGAAINYLATINCLANSASRCVSDLLGTTETITKR